MSLFHERLNILYKERTAQAEREGKRYSVRAFAAEAGITRQAMTNYLKPDYKSKHPCLPDLPMFEKLCSTFSVSADWLLGLTDIRTPDADAKAICSKTGLSEKAVLALTGKFHGLVDVNRISDFITDLRFLEVTLPLKQYNNISPNWTNTVFASHSPEGNIILPPIDAARFYLNEAVDAFRKMLFEDFENEWKEVIEEERNYNPDL